MKALRLLGALWLLPVAIPVWLFYVLPFWALGFLELRKRVGWSFIFAALVARAQWWRQRWDAWGGHTMPFAIMLHVEDFDKPALLAHERRHEAQWFVLGPLFPVVYGVQLLLYGYSNHPLEHDARKNPVRD